ncbi:jg23431 [Pararge aegeria aegeria]|uniref:Jg23431 protein n=1 Tax=Pararge aegeria aegeria TaxID=348720 RepID=A0A8S4S327_9NEOP|nr:jg23431 [Pararge aegeria aegeria]
MGRYDDVVEKSLQLRAPLSGLRMCAKALPVKRLVGTPWGFGQYESGITTVPPLGAVNPYEKKRASIGLAKCEFKERVPSCYNTGKQACNSGALSMGVPCLVSSRVFDTNHKAGTEKARP